MPAFSEKELKKLARIWWGWLQLSKLGLSSSHAVRVATFKGLESETGRSWKSYEYKTFEFSACAAWLGVGPVMGFPGCPSQKDKQEQAPEGVEFGGVGFLRWHGNRSATRKAVEDVARENNVKLKPLIRAGKVKK
jgi:hypothetical protein